MDYIQYKTAIQRLGDMLDAYRHNDQRPPLEQEAVQDSLIKRFEYTLETAWKTCKRHLEAEGFVEAKTGSPKSIIRLAAQRNLLSNPEAWFGYLQFRQDTWCNGSIHKTTAEMDTIEHFFSDVVSLYQRMTGTLD